MAEFYYPARVTLKYEDHSTPDLGGRHCHVRLFQLKKGIENST
jgi:hypothetical protein